MPLTWKPDRGSAEAYVRVREQARIQVEGRQTGRLCWEPLPVEDGFGLARLPEPSIGDVIFLDLEGDPFVGEHGLEYLFGFLATDDKGQLQYHCDWAFSRAGEKRAFEHLRGLRDGALERHTQTCTSTTMRRMNPLPSNG